MRKQHSEQMEWEVQSLWGGNILIWSKTVSGRREIVVEDEVREEEEVGDHVDTLWVSVSTLTSIQSEMGNH